MLHEFIEKNYSQAVAIQADFDHDTAMVRMMQPDAEFEPATVRNWMRGYGLFQGIKGQTRDDIVRSVQHLRQELPVSISSKSSCEKELIIIVRRFHDVQPRLWLSAASKILWCRYPEDVVIYDAFVERSLTVLQWLETCLLDKPRLGAKPTNPGNADEVGTFYSRHEQQVRALYSKYQKLLAKLRHQHPHDYPFDIRILDKLLWLLALRSARGAAPR